VIHEVDESIRNLLRLNMPVGTDVEVAFDAPTKDWASRRNAPTIDVYLYDIREDLRRREIGRFDQRAADGRVDQRLQPPRWYKLSYLLTAWTQRPEDEHRLLAAMLQRFLQDDRLPDGVLTGSLAALGYPIPYTCALPPPEDRALSDVWSALGGELKPSLDLVVVAPFDLGREIAFGPPVLEGPQLVVAGGASKATKRGRGKATAGATEDAAGGEAAGATAAGGGSGGRRGRRSDGGPGSAGEEPRRAAEVRSGGRRGNTGRRIFITELPT
jgi:hypothetical protein